MPLRRHCAWLPPQSCHDQFRAKFLRFVLQNIDSPIRSANIQYRDNEQFGLSLSIDTRTGIIANSIPKEFEPSQVQMDGNWLALKVQSTGSTPKPMQVLAMSFDGSQRSKPSMRR
jgi:hypothetical protein